MRLSANLDLSAATPLWTQICAARQQPIVIDASDVERLGGLCLQVLMAAQIQWRTDGVAFSIVSPSPAFVETIALAGVDQLLGEAA